MPLNLAVDSSSVVLSTDSAKNTARLEALNNAHDALMGGIGQLLTDIPDNTAIREAVEELQTALYSFLYTVALFMEKRPGVKDGEKDMGTLILLLEGLSDVRVKLWEVIKLQQASSIDVKQKISNFVKPFTQDDSVVFKLIKELPVGGLATALQSRIGGIIESILGYINLGSLKAKADKATEHLILYFKVMLGQCVLSGADLNETEKAMVINVSVVSNDEGMKRLLHNWVTRNALSVAGVTTEESRARLNKLKNNRSTNISVSSAAGSSASSSPIASTETNEELISKARKELVTAIKTLSATFKATSENKGWESIPEVNRLMTTVDKLAPALDKLLDAIAARLEHPDGKINAMTYIHPMLDELGNVRKIMSELVSAEEDVNSLTAEQFVIFQNARDAIDNFVIPLLDNNSIVNKLSNKIPLDLVLLKPILASARKWFTSAVNLVLGGAGLQSVNEQQDINNLFDVMLRQVITPGKVLPADPANKSYKNVNIKKEIQLPERKDKRGKGIIPWNGEQPAHIVSSTSSRFASIFQEVNSVVEGYNNVFRCSDANLQAAKNILTLLTALNAGNNINPEFKVAVLKYYLEGRILYAENRHKGFGIMTSCFGTKSRLVNALNIARDKITLDLSTKTVGEKTEYETYIKDKIGQEALKV